MTAALKVSRDRKVSPIRDLARHLSSLDLTEAAVMAIDLRTARASMVPYRSAYGFIGGVTKLLTAPDENLKLTHSETDKVAGFGLSLAPAGMASVNPSYHLVLDGTVSEAFYWTLYGASVNTCRFSTPGCRSACLATSGNGRYSGTQMGRVWKTRWIMAEPLHFLRVLVDEIDRVKVDAWQAAGWTVSFRFNVLSDIPWETIAPWILRRLADRGIRCYDYTAYPSARRDRKVSAGLGYYLVDSVKETHTAAQIDAMARPVVVFDVKRGHALPETYRGRPVIDADRSDARFLDAEGTVRGLRFKDVSTTKRSLAITSGFVKNAA